MNKQVCSNEILNNENLKSLFPSVEELERICKKVEDSEYNRVNQGLSDFPTKVEVEKYKLCKDILKYKQEKNLTTEEVAKKLNLSVDKTEKILFSHFNELNLEELVKYVSFLNLPFFINISNNNYIRKSNLNYRRNSNVIFSQQI